MEYRISRIPNISIGLKGYDYVKIKALQQISVDKRNWRISFDKREEKPFRKKYEFLLYRGTLLINCKY